METRPVDPQILFNVRSSAQSGGRWFYWIAGLSLINSVIFITGGNTSFIVGLGLTQLIDGLCYHMHQANAVSLILDIIVAWLFAGIGYMACKLNTWAFIVGMIIYAMDAVIFLIVPRTPDFLSMGFHAYALYCIWRGFNACRLLKRIDQAAQNSQSISQA